VRIHGGPPRFLRKMLARKNAAFEANDVVGYVDTAEEMQRLCIGNNLEN